MNLLRALRTPAPVHTFALGASHLLYARLHRGRKALERVETQTLGAEWFSLGPVGLLHVDRAALANALTPLLARLEKPPQKASVVIPNGWLRSVVVDVGALPRQRQEAEEIVRWRLKKLLPCRPEDVRLDFIRGGDNGRLLVMLALDRPLGVIEDAFLAAGVHVGRLEPSVLALTTLLPPASDPALLVMVEERTLALVLVVAGKVALVRHKALPLDDRRAEAFVLRELARTLAHAREREAVSGVLNVWVTAPNTLLSELLAQWAGREQGVVIHQLSVGAGRVPELPQVETVKLWSLLATAWEGEV